MDNNKSRSTIKTAVIIAGGLGTRLRPVTYTTPKPLIMIRNKTLLECVIDKVLEAKVKHIFLSIGYLHDKIISFVNNIKSSYPYVDFHFLVEDKPLGTAGWLNLISNKEKSKYFNEEFIVVNGDNLFDLDWELFANAAKGAATIALTPVEDVSAYGVAKLNNGKIEAFVEKPDAESAPSNKINSGYYILSPAVFGFAKNKKKLMFETDIFPALAKQGQLYYYIDNAKWFDTGTFERWKRASDEWKS